MSGRMVWLASYPKSGNTWLRAVLTALRHRAPLDINALVEGLPISAERVVFDLALGIRSSDLTADEVDCLRPRADEVAGAGLADDCWRKVHDGLYPGPCGELVVSVQVTRAAIYMVRDPRAVAVSLAHHFGQPLEWAVERLALADNAISNSGNSLGPQLRQRLGSWSDHVLSWVEQRAFPVHVIRYEDCVSDPVATFRGALAAGGLHASEADVSEAVVEASWVRLRAQEEAAGFKERISHNASFFRQGKSDAWREELPAALASRIATEHGDVMARFGY